MNANGEVGAWDLSILAGNYGTEVDPVTGELLQQTPGLAAAPTGDTNGDGVVNEQDLATVLGSFGQSTDPNFAPVEGVLTEAEASAIEGAFGQAMPQGLDCVWCAKCDKGWCQVLPDRFGEADGDGEPDFDDGTAGVDPPADSPGPGGGGPGSGTECRTADDDGDGVMNRADCDSPCPIDVQPCNGIDLDVNTNDLGSSNGVVDAEDEPLEASTSGLGAWIFASIGDADGDLIPDFADFPGSRPLAEVKLRVVALDPANATVRIEYEASDPAAVETDDEDASEYMPAEGKTRLWVVRAAHIPLDPRAFTEGGHYVPPGTYPLEQLRTLAPDGFALESVAASESIGDIEVKTTLLPDGISDTVRLTSVATGLFGVNAQGAYTPIKYPAVSASAPVIQNTQISFENVRPSSDGMQLVADLAIAGTVDDAASDLISGTEGIIGTIDLLFNGADLIDGATNTLIQIPVSAHKALQPTSVLKPHNFSGVFSRVILGVPVQPGVNTVELTARNHFGDVGTAIQGFSVSVRQPEITVQLGLPSWDSPDPRIGLGHVISATVLVDGGVLETFLLQSITTPGVFTDATGTCTISLPAYEDGVILVSPFWNHPTQIDTYAGRFTHTELCVTELPLTFVESGPATGIVTSDTFVLESECNDWWNSIIAPVAPPLGPVVATGQSELAGFTIGLVGPLEGLIESAAVGVAGEYSIVYEEINDRIVGLLSPDGVSPAILTARSTFEQEGQGVFTPDPIAAVITLLEAQAKFKLGVAQGLLDTGVSIYHGAAALGRIGGYAVWNYNPVSIRWRLNRGESPILAEDRARIAAATHAAQVLGEIALLIAVNENEFLSVVLQNNATINALGEKYSEIGSVAAEILVDVLDHVEQEAQEIAQDPFKMGRLAGRVLGEVGVTISPLAVAKIPQSAKALTVITRLRSIDEIAEIPGLAAKFDRLEDMFEGAADAGIDGEQMVRLLARVKRTDGLEGWAAFRKIMADTDTPERRAKFDANLRSSVKMVMDNDYARAITGGIADPSKVRTVQQLADEIAAAAWGARIGAAFLQNHHTIPKYLLKDLIDHRRPDLSPAQRRALMESIENDMPGYLVHKFDHVGGEEGVEAFHAILQRSGTNDGQLPTVPPTGSQLTRPYTPEQIDAGLQRAYQSWGRPEVWTVAREWLRQKGLLD